MRMTEPLQLIYVIILLNASVQARYGSRKLSSRNRRSKNQTTHLQRALSLQSRLTDGSSTVHSGSIVRTQHQDGLAVLASAEKASDNVLKNIFSVALPALAVCIVEPALTLVMIQRCNHKLNGKMFLIGFCSVIGRYVFCIAVGSLRSATRN